MTQNRNQLTFRRAEEAQVTALRQETDTVPIPMGYVPSNAAVPRAVTGDEKFAYFKDVPDLSVPYRYAGPVRVGLADAQLQILPAPNVPFANYSPTPDLGAFTELPIIDVRGIRALAFYVEFLTDGGMLEFIVDARIDPPGAGVQPQWFPLDVIDPSLSTSTTGGPTDPPPFLLGGAVRQLYAAEQRINGQAYTFADMLARGGMRGVFVYDVAWYDEVRMRIADVVLGTSGVNILFKMGR